MHDVFMGKPSYKFHKKESTYKSNDIHRHQYVLVFKINHLYQVKKHSTDPVVNQKDVSHSINYNKIF